MTSLVVLVKLPQVFNIPMAIYTGTVPSGKFLLQQMVNSSKLKMKF
jgi:methylglyoxal synthase